MFPGAGGQRGAHPGLRAATRPGAPRRPATAPAAAGGMLEGPDVTVRPLGRAAEAAGGGRASRAAGTGAGRHRSLRCAACTARPQSRRALPGPGRMPRAGGDSGPHAAIRRPRRRVRDFWSVQAAGTSPPVPAYGALFGPASALPSQNRFFPWPTCSTSLSKKPSRQGRIVQSNPGSRDRAVSGTSPDRPACRAHQARPASRARDRRRRRAAPRAGRLMRKARRHAPRDRAAEWPGRGPGGRERGEGLRARPAPRRQALQRPAGF